MQRRPLDPACPLEKQIEGDDVKSVVLLNVFTLDAADEDAFLKAWQTDGAFMKQQPGFISAQLHRAVGESLVYLNYAVWESSHHFKAAFLHPAFRSKLTAYPASAVASPHLFQKLSVPGICVA